MFDTETFLCRGFSRTYAVQNVMDQDASLGVARHCKASNASILKRTNVQLHALYVDLLEHRLANPCLGSIIKVT